jgi:hypothetical protein
MNKGPINIVEWRLFIGSPKSLASLPLGVTNFLLSISTQIMHLASFLCHFAMIQILHVSSGFNYIDFCG